MARRKKIARKQIDAVLDLLDRIENELPSGSSITISEEGSEVEIELEEDRGVEVGDVDVAIDLAVMEFQNDGILPKRKKGTYSLSAVFEILFGKKSTISELAIDLETTLSGYEDMIWNDEAESALELIEEIRDRINEVSGDAALAEQD